MDTTDQRRPNLTAITLAVVITAYAIFTVLGMPDGMLGVAWPSMRATFDLAQGQMGLLLLASTVGFLITSFGVGRLFAAFGVVGVLIVATIVRGAGLVSIGLAPEAWALFLSAFVFGLGSGAIDAGLNTYFAMNLSPRLMNWLHAFFGVGATLGPILMTTVLSLGAAWRWGYVIVGVVQAALAIAIFAKAGAWKARAETGTYAAENKVTKQKSYAATLRRPIVWLNIALFFFYAGLEVTAGNWSYSIFTEARGVPITLAGFWTSFYWASFTFGRFFFGFVADRVNVVNTIRLMLVIALLSTVLMWWNPVNWVGFIGLAVLGFAMAPVFPLLISDTPARLGVADATNAIGFQVGAASFGIAILPGFAGLLAERVSLEAILPFMAGAFVLLIAMYEIAERGHSKGEAVA